jgi:segregation and condensation protein A
MAHRVPITIRVETFEGPLDLLLYLIQSHEMDISKISIARITDQYLEYVRLIQELNFDTASEFLVMAATLLHWKSKTILPQEESLLEGAEEEIGLTQEDLIRQLMEHQRFLAAGQTLSELPRLHEDVFKRNNDRPPIEKIWKEMNLTDLALGYQDILVRARKRTQVLKKETVSLTDQMTQFGERLKIGELTDLRKFLKDNPSRAEIVVTFLASLELSRLKKMRVHQEGTFTPIFLELLQSLQGFDFSLATGFDNPNPPEPAKLIEQEFLPTPGANPPQSELGANA